MSSNVKRLLVEKREGFDFEAKALMKDLKDSLHIDCIDDLRLLNRYDIEGLSDEVCDSAAKTIFSEPNLDVVYKETVEYDKDAKVFAVEYLPGQYDQRADWAAQCVQIINEGQRPNINSAKLYILSGDIDDELFAKIIVQETFRRQGLEVTFMPKPIEGVAGSGMHVHLGVSLKLTNGKRINLFEAPKEDYYRIFTDWWEFAIFHNR